MPRSIKSYINEIAGTPDNNEKENIRNQKVVTRRSFICSIGGSLLAGGLASYILFDGNDNDSKSKEGIAGVAYRMPKREEKLPVKAVELIIGRKADCNNFDPGYCHLLIQTEYDLTGDGNLNAVELHLYPQTLDISKKDIFRMWDNFAGAQMVGLTGQPIDSELPIGHPNRRKGSYPTLVKKGKGEYVIKTLWGGVTKYQ